MAENLVSALDELRNFRSRSHRSGKAHQRRLRALQRRADIDELAQRLRRANEEILQLRREIKVVHATYRDDFIEAVLVKVSQQAREELKNNLKKRLG